MQGYSDRPGVFEDLTLRAALTLIETLERSKLRTEPHVRRLFCRFSQGFDAALTFLIRLRVVERSEGELVISSQPPEPTGTKREIWLLSRILAVRNNYRAEVFSYLRKYRVEDGDLLYHPPIELRSRESNVRNFLMELGVVHAIWNGTGYKVSPDYISLYAQAIDRQRKVSPESLVNSFAARDVLGLMVEEAVVNYERSRVGAERADRVEHVSLRNVAAGYDIQSISVTDGGAERPRYIEVKAVSAGSMGFYWTRNEIAVAKTLGNFYFLYLVPVSPKVGIDDSRMYIICNPHQAVIQTQEEWVTEADVVRCSLRSH
jgi:hypothetical protein